MSEAEKAPNRPTPEFMIGLKELGELLIKEKGLKTGLFEVSMEISVAIGNFSLSDAKGGPGTVMTIGGVGLIRANEPGPFTVDAGAIARSLAGPAPDLVQGRKTARTMKVRTPKQ